MRWPPGPDAGRRGRTSRARDERAPRACDCRPAGPARSSGAPSSRRSPSGTPPSGTPRAAAMRGRGPRGRRAIPGAGARARPRRRSRPRWPRAPWRNAAGAAPSARSPPGPGRQSETARSDTAERRVSAGANSPSSIIASPAWSSSRCAAGSSGGSSAAARRSRVAVAGMSPLARARCPAEDEVGRAPSSDLGGVLVDRPELRRGSGTPPRGGIRGSPRTRARDRGRRARASRRIARAARRASASGPRGTRRPGSGCGTKRKASCPANDDSWGPMSSLAMSRSRLGPTCSRTSSGDSSSTAPRKNTCPITEPRSTTARSAEPRRSSRAESSAPIVGGMSSAPRSDTRIHPPSAPRCSVPSSISIDSICSTNSGLPSAACTIRTRTRSSSAARPSRFWTTSELSSSDRGSRRTSRASGAPRPIRDGRGAARAWRSRAAPPACPRSSSPGSTAGRGRSAPPSGCPRPARSAVGPVRGSPGGGGRPRRSPGRGTTARTGRSRPRSRSVTSSAPVPRRRPSLADAASSESSLSTPAASRAISPSGQNVMPSPYERHRPRSWIAVSRERSRNSRSSRDLPTPAGATTVTRRHVRVCRACVSVSESSESSSSRPTMGASRCLETPSSRETASSR